MTIFRENRGVKDLAESVGVTYAGDETVKNHEDLSKEDGTRNKLAIQA